MNKKIISCLIIFLSSFMTISTQSFEEQYEEFKKEAHQNYASYRDEYKTIIILFSPSEIGKRTGFNSSIEDKPENISYKDFKQWLIKTLSKDNKLQFQELNITISK